MKLSFNERSLKMLFKISNDKTDRNSYKPENSLTYVKTHIPNIEMKVNMKSKDKSGANLARFIKIIAVVLLFVSIPLIVLYFRYLPKSVKTVTESNVCHHKQRLGSCLTNDYCCDGEHVLGKDICKGIGFCCLGHITPCNGQLQCFY